MNMIQHHGTFENCDILFEILLVYVTCGIIVYFIGNGIVFKLSLLRRTAWKLLHV